MGSNWLVLGLVLYIFIPNRTTYLDKKRDIIRVHSATVRGPVGVWYIILLSVLTIVAPWGRIRGGNFLFIFWNSYISDVLEYNISSFLFEGTQRTELIYF